MVPNKQGSGMHRHKEKLALIIVTYNRSADLANTLTQLVSMESEFEHIVLVDNASTDDTRSLVDSFQEKFNKKLQFEALESNTGGAGGFNHGLQTAMKLDADWFWLSDDDAIPENGSLLKIRDAAVNSSYIYGSTAIVGDSVEGELCWPSPLLYEPDTASSQFAFFQSELNALQPVGMIPFLGFMIHRKKVNEIGLPDKRFFISGDDLEYSTRARMSGGKILQVKDSVVRHPRIPRYTVSIFGWQFYCLSIAPWRRYFEVRNRMWSARRRLGYIGTLASLLSNIIRMFISLAKEEQKPQLAAAYFRGIVAGLNTPPVDLSINQL